MSEPGGDIVDLFALVEQQGGVLVSQRVQHHGREPTACDELAERGADADRVPWPTVRSWEYEPEVVPAGAHRETVFALTSTVVTQHLDRAAADLHATHGPARLRLTDRHLAVDHDRVPSDVDDAGAEVDVVPADAERLTTP